MEKNCIFYCYRKTRRSNHHITNKIKKVELVMFDMDGVLTDILSSWKYIHDYFNTSNERSVDDYLKGKIDDMEFIRRDASLWKENGKPIKKDKLVEILSDVPLMKGAKECINYLSGNNIKTTIVSAGLDILADRVAKDLGINHVLANGIRTDRNGYLNGKGILGVKLMYKDLAVRSFAKKNKIPLESIVSVGNSCFDIPMFEMTGLSIAFNPGDECTKKAADILIESKDLSEILCFIKDYI